MAGNWKNEAIDLSIHVNEPQSPVSEYEGSGGQKHGSSHDDADMQRLGKSQQLNRNFHSLSVLGLTCVVMGTWLGMLTASTFSLINGGTGGTIWVYVATWFCSIAVVASMAEMASMAPSSGGQYHWVSEFAPPSAQKFLSYIAGWLSALGWQAFIAVSAYQAGALILTLASVANPSYQPAPWQNTLMTIAIAGFAVLFNIFGAKRLPMFEGVILFFHILGFFAILIPLWTLAPMSKPSEVFGTFDNFGGWSSVGAACIVGQLASAGAFIGADSAAHMAEEVKNASITVPRMMIGTIVLNGILGLVMTITFVFTIQDVQTQIVESTAVYPFIDVFRVAVGSTAGAIGMTVPMVVLSTSMCLNAVAAASRQAWSFARDDGMPFPSFFCRIRVVSGTPLPINAMLSSLFICMVLALINLGGSEAFNSIMGLVTGAVGLTYALSIACVLWRRMFGEPLPHARWSLGRFGAPLNAFAVLYECFTTCISFFPLFAKVNAQTMNWGIAMFGGVAILCIINYAFAGRKVYKGPVVFIQRD
ncbi:GABA-specific permease [Polychaeton citri CBS 116435]|uniref:GABA-specific permease n=1 Tax=Polychaeton citri CBS 116435 TaxID=1314669 RepID=A0A9P4Q0T0_9PEZI|nr:GABA-specific permease [Polychaeton citri CBS 116435]